MLRISFIVLLMLFARQTLPAISTLDDAGEQIVFSSPAKRIISLAPHITELLFAIGVGDRIVATVEYSDYPPAAKQIKRIGGYNAIDLESILTLQPDLIIAWRSGNNPVQVEKLQALGIPVFINEPRHIADIPETARRLAILTGRDKRAKEFIEEFNQHHDSLNKRFASRRPVKLFYEVWHEPLMTINGQHLISDVIRLCGATNIFSDVPVLAPSVSIESVVQAGPDIIVAGASRHTQQDLFIAWQHWPQLPAVATKQLYSINPDLMQRHGPRILQGAEQLCEYIEQTRRIKYAGDESLQVPGTGQ